MPKQKIIIVDDDPETSDLEHHLKDYVLVFEKDSENALATIVKVKPDLIVLDLTMPNLSGFDVALEIRCDARVSHIPMIFATFNNDQAEELRAYKEFGARDWLIKPFFFEVLRLSVQRQLELGNMQLQLNGPVLALGCGQERFIKNLNYPVIVCDADYASAEQALKDNNPSLIFVYCEIGTNVIRLIKDTYKGITVGVLRPLQLGSLEQKTKDIMTEIAHTTIKSNMTSAIVNAKIAALIDR